VLRGFTDLPKGHFFVHQWPLPRGSSKRKKESGSGGYNWPVLEFELDTDTSAAAHNCANKFAGILRNFEKKYVSIRINGALPRVWPA